MQTLQELADRISSISVSSTMKVAADADRLRREGADVVDFGAGEPDFPTPDNIKQRRDRRDQSELHQVHQHRRHRRAEAGHLRPSQDRLRHRLHHQGMHRHRRRQARDLQSDAGADRSGRRSHHPGALLGHLQGRGQLRRRQVRVRRHRRSRKASRSAPRWSSVHFTPKTKMIILNSPSNPSGAVFARAELEQIFQHRQGSRHLGHDRRVLPPLPLRRRAVLAGGVSGREGHGGGGRIAFEDLRDDRLAHRIRAGARRR